MVMMLGTICLAVQTASLSASMSASKRASDLPRGRATPRPYVCARRRYRNACDALDAYVAEWEATHGRIAASRRQDDGVGDPMVTRIVSVLWDVIQARTVPADEAMRCLKLSNQAMQEVTRDASTPLEVRCEHHLGRGAGDADDGFSINTISTETLLSLDPFVFCVNCIHARSQSTSQKN